MPLYQLGLVGRSSISPPTVARTSPLKPTSAASAFSARVPPLHDATDPHLALNDDVENSSPEHVDWIVVRIWIQWSAQESWCLLLLGLLANCNTERIFLWTGFNGWMMSGWLFGSAKFIIPVNLVCFGFPTTESWVVFHWLGRGGKGNPMNLHTWND